MANLERIYTIPLGDAYEHVRYKRGKRAIAMVRAFAIRHMKADAAKVSEGVNSLIFRDGIEKPPRKLKVRIVKGDGGVARVWLIGEEEKLKAAAEEKKKKEEAAKKNEQEKKEASKAAKKEKEKAAENKPESGAKAAKPEEKKAEKPAEKKAAPAEAKKPEAKAPAAPAKQEGPSAKK